MKKLSGSLVLISILSSTSCSGGSEVPATVINQAYQLGVQQGTKKNNIDSIIATIGDIKNQLDNFDGSVIAAPPPSNNQSQTTTPIKTSAKTAIDDKATSLTTKPTTPRQSTKKPKANKPNAREIANKLLNKIRQAPFIQAEVEKYEKHLDNGDISTNKLQLFQNQAGLVKIDVLYSSKGSTGVKLLYTSGVDKKIKVRPNGGLSFLTTDLPIMDERLTSVNGYPLDKTDFKGLSNRLGQASYKAELIGATKVNGKKVHVLKMIATGQNELEARISHEHIGYDPETLDFKFWEAYSSGSKEAFYRLKLNEFKVLPSIPSDKFKL